MIESEEERIVIYELHLEKRKSITEETQEVSPRQVKVKQGKAEEKDLRCVLARKQTEVSEV